MVDADGIRSITDSQLGYDAPLELVAGQLQKLIHDEENNYILVFEDQKSNEIVGYVHASLYEPLYARPMFNILALAVRKGSTRSGVGKALMVAVEKEATARDLAGVRLNSGFTRIEAHQFYKQIGYTSDKDQKRFMKIIK